MACGDECRSTDPALPVEDGGKSCTSPTIAGRPAAVNPGIIGSACRAAFHAAGVATADVALGPVRTGAVQILNGELTMVTPYAENPWAERVVLTPVAAHTFTMTSPGLTSSAINEPLTCEVDETGHVTRVRTPSGTWLREGLKAGQGRAWATG